MNISSDKALVFLNNTGDMGQLILQHDWDLEKLGPPADWPLSLKSITNIILRSGFPMFLAWGEQLTFIYNDAYSKILGKKHPEALGGQFKDIWTEVWEKISPIVTASMEGKSSYFENMPLVISRNGFDEIAWFTFSYSPVFSDDGVVAGMYCVCNETTRQVLAEKQNEREIGRLSELFRQAPGFIAVVKEPGHIFEVANDSYLQLIGNRDVVGKQFRDAIPELAEQGYVDILDNVFVTGEPYVGRAIRVQLQRLPDAPMEEHFLDFVFQPVRGDNDIVSGVFIQGNDVSETVRAIQALHQSEQRFRKLANSIPQLVWVANPDGNVYWYNDRWYEYTGIAPERLEADSWERVHDPKNLQRIRIMWRHSIESGEAFEGIFPLLSAEKKYRQFYCRMAPITDSRGEIDQWVGAYTDVTAIEETKEKLILANKRKDEILSMLAHELRNPFSAIQAAAEVLKFSPESDLKIKKVSDIIIRQVFHLSTRLDNLLDLSDLNRGKISLSKKICDITLLLRNSIEQVQSKIYEKRHNLNFSMEENIYFSFVDDVRMTQVFANILINSIEYMQAGGNISIQVNRVEDFIKVNIDDAGAGINPDVRPYLFELFSQGQRSASNSMKGFGLGLALAKSFTDMHNGIISFEGPGSLGGSRFCISLPAHNL